MIFRVLVYNIYEMTTYFGPTKLTEEEKRQRHNDSQRKCYYRNIEKRKEYNKKYYENHRIERLQHMKEYNKKWRESIKKIREENKELKAENKELKEDNERLKGLVNYLGCKG